MHQSTLLGRLCRTGKTNKSHGGYRAYTSGQHRKASEKNHNSRTELQEDLLEHKEFTPNNDAWISAKIPTVPAETARPILASLTKIPVTTPTTIAKRMTVLTTPTTRCLLVAFLMRIAWHWPPVGIVPVVKPNCSFRRMKSGPRRTRGSWKAFVRSVRRVLLSMMTLRGYS